MRLTFLGNTYETNLNEVSTALNGKVGIYRGKKVSFRSAQVQMVTQKALTYRGRDYNA